MSSWLYLVACVVGPAAWGLLMYVAFDAVDRRRTRAPRDEAPPVDYSI